MRRSTRTRVDSVGWLVGGHQNLPTGGHEPLPTGGHAIAERSLAAIDASLPASPLTAPWGRGSASALRALLDAVSLDARPEPSFGACGRVGAGMPQCRADRAPDGSAPVVTW